MQLVSSLDFSVTLLSCKNTRGKYFTQMRFYVPTLGKEHTGVNIRSCVKSRDFWEHLTVTNHLTTPKSICPLPPSDFKRSSSTENYVDKFPFHTISKYSTFLLKATETYRNSPRAKAKTAQSSGLQ